MTGYTQQQWQEEYEDHPVRLLVTCRREGYEPWTLLREVGDRRRAGRDEAGHRDPGSSPGRATGRTAGVLPKGEPKQVHMLVVTNTSSRPIRNLAAGINVPGSPYSGQEAR